MPTWTVNVVSFEIIIWLLERATSRVGAPGSNTFSMLSLYFCFAVTGWTRYSLLGDPLSGEHNLVIDSAELGDDAVYECQATQAGLRSHRAKLTVLGKNRIVCVFDMIEWA